MQYLQWLREHKVWLGTGLVLMAFGWYVYSNQATPLETPLAKNTVETVKKGDIRIRVSGSGQIEAESQVDLKPVAAGDAIEVTAVLVKNDQEVKKGQLIATIDAEDARRDVSQAELSLKAAKIKMQQMAKESPKRTEDDTLVRRTQEISVKQQELALQKSLSKLADYSIRAPFDGIVTGLTVDGGDTISQTAVLASVITKNMKVVISLNEVDAAKVGVGNEATLTFDALPTETATGKITKLDTIGVATQGVVSYGAEITLDMQSPRLKPGMSVTADILVDEKKDVLVIPNTALMTEEGKTWVRIAPNRTADNTTTSNSRTQTAVQGERRAITLGITDNVTTEVVGGLNEGERIMVPSVTSGTTTSQNTQSAGGILNLFRGSNTNRGNFNR